ncbi:MAG: twin-arginine translocase TatA/TatE family subunit [Bacteroidota bacterium]|nr:twin-arginine translocase TatA/TatE family subunit [Bacteroidota bacterium]MDP4204368.1 twin-arginine translocase TatA/TatE family subunit [Bacteroidota bacterium]
METLFVMLLSMPGGGEWVLILLVVLFLFGGKKIPELMKGIGQGMKEFKKASQVDEDSPKEDASKKQDSIKE